MRNRRVGIGARRLVRCERGAVVTLVGIMMPALLGAGALGVDVARMTIVRGQLQAAADAAARASVTAVSNPAKVREIALSYARENMPPSAHGEVLQPGDIRVGRWTTGSENPSFVDNPVKSVNAVRVTTRRGAANGNPLHMALAPVLGITQSDLAATATAAQLADGKACVLALAEQGAGIRHKGAVDISARDCGFAANSRSYNALDVDGAAADAHLRSLYLAGGLEDRHNTIATTQKKIVNAGAGLGDPYARRDFDQIPEGQSPTAGVKPKPNKAITLEPGVYPDGLTLKGNVELQSGVYVVEGNLDIKGSAEVTGEGVTLVQRDPDVAIAGAAEVDLSAPSSGVTRGIVLMRLGREGGASAFGGNADMTLNGAVYMPKARVSFHGTVDNAGCLQIVARRVTFRGSADFAHDCKNLGTNTIGFGGARLVR